MNKTLPTLLSALLLLPGSAQTPAAAPAAPPSTAADLAEENRILRGNLRKMEVILVELRRKLAVDELAGPAAQRRLAELERSATTLQSRVDQLTREQTAAAAAAAKAEQALAELDRSRRAESGKSAQLVAQLQKTLADDRRVRDEMAARLGAAERRAEELTAAVTAEREEATAAVASRDRDLKAASERAAAVEKQAAEAAREMAGARQAAEAAARAAVEAELKEAAALKPALEAATAENAALAAKARESEAAQTEAMRRTADADARLRQAADLENRLLEAVEKRQLAEENLRRLGEHVTELRGQLAKNTDLERRLTESERRLAEAAKSAAETASLRQAQSEAQSKLAAAQRATIEAAEQIRTLSASVESLRRERDDLAAGMQDKTGGRQKLEEAVLLQQRQINDLKAALLAARKQVEEAADRAIAAGGMDAKSAEKLTALEAELKTVRGELAGLTTARNDLQNANAMYARQVEDLKTKLDKAATVPAPVGADMDKLRQENERLKAGLDESAEKLTAAEARVAWLTEQQKEVLARLKQLLGN